MDIGEIFRRYGGEYLKRFGERMLPSHKKAIHDISKCRTEAAGGHVYKCPGCGHKEYSYHSCGNRSCPQCHRADNKEWLQKREMELLPVPYFHLVFTLPSQLREVTRSNQKLMYDLLFKAAVSVLKEIARESKYLGGEIGILCALHTWNRRSDYHVHLHCLVPGVGISTENAPDKGMPLEKQHLCFTKKTKKKNKDYFAPGEKLSYGFRKKFLELAENSPIKDQLPKRYKSPNKWVAYCKSTAYGPVKALEYLARYFRGIAMTNNRIVSVQNDVITFKYKWNKDSKDSPWRYFPVEAMEFMRRFLQHVLPKGFHKVRYYGFLSPTNRHLLTQINSILQAENATQNIEGNQPEPVNGSGDSGDHNRKVCPKCKKCEMVFLKRLFPQKHPLGGRSPPCSSS